MAQAKTIGNQDLNMSEPPSQAHLASKKRSFNEFMKSQQLVIRFKAKSDFLQYFTESRKSARPLV